MRRESLLVGCALIGTLTLFSGCRTAQKSNEKQILTKIESNADESASENKTSKQNVLGEPTGSMALSYAENFSVDYYGDYTLLKTKDGTQILTVPEDKDIPDNLDEDIVVLKQPVDGILLGHLCTHAMQLKQFQMDLDCISASILPFSTISTN